MKKLALVCLILSIGFASFAQSTIHCLIKTDMGNIAIELYADKAPVTVANFMNYVDKQLYKGSSFFRVCTRENEATRKVKIEVIQGGNVPAGSQADSIKIETTKQTGLRHEDGTLSMARSGPNTATSEFFVCINAQPALDYGGARNADGYGFAAFGKVTSGMEIVKKIQSGKNKGQRLLEPVKIEDIVRVK